MLREYSTNHYGIAPYFASRLCMELFVTGCQVTLSSVLTFFLMALGKSSISFGPCLLVDF